MRRITPLTPQGVIEYNLRDGGTAVTVFEDTQTYRVDKARSFIRSILSSQIDRATIVELGCSAGDISGPFSFSHDVLGVDLVPAAVALSRQRYPGMTVVEGTAESIEPHPCDIIVLCEFLEHIEDPAGLVQRWLPMAKYSIIGHPLNDPGYIEPGHVWSYTLDDYKGWFPMGGHVLIETHLFTGPFPEMVMGVSQRA